MTADMLASGSATTRPASQLSSSTSSTGSSWSTSNDMASSRPSSFGSDIPISTRSGAAPITRTQSTDARPTRHALLRTRRTSMPHVPLAADGGAALNSAKLPVPSHIALQKKRLSTASARSCDSLPEETEFELDHSASAGLPKSAPPATKPGSSLPVSDIPLPSRRIRPKASVRRSSMNPTGSTSSSPASSRPVSLALASATPVIASNAHGETSVLESKTLARNMKSRMSANKQAVRFDAPPPTRSVLTVQAYNTAKKTARSARKDRIANEILETERIYVATLEDVQHHFLTPLLASAKSEDALNPPVLPAKVIKEIFSNFGDIHNLAKEVLRRLEESATLISSPIPVGPPSTFEVFAMAPGSPSSGSARGKVPPPLAVPRPVGQTLLPVMPFLKCYSLFVGNFAAAQARLDKEDRTNELWKSFVADKKASGIGGKLNLSAMLLCIVQRIPRYRLLLGDLLRFTETNDPDYEGLRGARAAVEKVAEHLEGSIKQHETSMAILDLQRSIIGLDFQLISPGRRLLKLLLYADVQYGWSRAIAGYPSGHGADMHSAASDRSRMSVLLPGHLLGASIANATLTYKRKLDLIEISVAGAEGSAFEILSSVKSFSIIASPPQSKYEWVTAIRDAKDDLMKSKRTLLTVEEEQRRSRDRRLSMPVLPSRSISTPILSTLMSAKDTLYGSGGRPNPIVRLPSLDDEIKAQDEDDNFDEPQFAERSTGDDAESVLFSPVSEVSFGHRSQRSSQDGWLSSSVKDLKIHEDYRAPIWVPDSRAERCMRCREPFAVWRRRHHCRLCGDVVCWACSTKRFAIPAEDGQGATRVGRACDACYETCFGPDTPRDGIAEPLGASTSSSLLADAIPLPLDLKRAISGFDVSLSDQSELGSRARPEQAPVHRGKARVSLSAPQDSVELLRSVLARSQ